MVPIIETARLRLRCLTERDLDPWTAVTADPEVVRYLGGAAISREETWRRILATVGAWHVLGYGYWAVERKDRDGIIGHVGFSDFKRDLSPSIEGVPEMGWVFARDAHGQGFASEAVTAALRWATDAGSEEIAASSISNAGIRFASRKSGFTVRERRNTAAPILLFRRVRPASFASAEARLRAPPPAACRRSRWEARPGISLKLHSRATTADRRRRRRRLIGPAGCPPQRSEKLLPAAAADRSSRMGGEPG
jgi:RimJ/RimL family protein N-acetyltransferase